MKKVLFDSGLTMGAGMKSIDLLPGKSKKKMKKVVSKKKTNNSRSRKPASTKNNENLIKKTA